MTDTPDRPHLAADLYHGAADDYDRYRPPYPEELIAALVADIAPPRHGLLVDLACGPGPLTFALAGRFADVLAVDQEPDMIRLVAAKAAARGTAVRTTVAAAEMLDLEPGSVELVAIGMAFHRLDRDEVARRVRTWLTPVGHVALFWASVPWQDQRVPWQRAVTEFFERWRDRLGVRERVPDSWLANHRQRADRDILAGAGLGLVARREVRVAQTWDAARLAGYAYSTSLLPRAVFGDRTAEFERELADHVRPFGELVTEAAFGYELAAPAAE